MTKFFNNLKKHYFWGDFFFFLNKKYGSVTHNFIWVSDILTCQNLERINDPTPRKRPD